MRSYLLKRYGGTILLFCISLIELVLLWDDVNELAWDDINHISWDDLFSNQPDELYNITESLRQAIEEAGIDTETGKKMMYLASAEGEWVDHLGKLLWSK